ncbi:pentatricopeptide repeat-containing protein At4g01030, mitochondrial [Typha angustifolia]|uniref:pentatricopeptide repeat-containing protein At4g01030, mitochondrial n=1 Tax=Typha angustifolia TaxID=59011 RepID=UPI003C2D916C
MEQAISLSHFMPSSSPKNSSTHKRRRNRITPISQALQIQDSAFETQCSNSSLTLEPMFANSLLSVKQVHAHFIKTTAGWSSTPTMDKLIQMYLNFGDYQSAAMVFFMGLQCGVLSWSYLIDIFKSEGSNPHELLEVFRELHRIGVAFSVGILVFVLRICSEVLGLWLGLQIHGLLIKQGLDSETYIKCSMMDFYADCCSLDSADKLFEEIPNKEAILWNKLVVLNVEKEEWVKALELFHKMQYLGVEADGVTIAKVLHACGKFEALKDGKAIHGYVIRSGFSSNILVSNSLITMYSKNSAIKLARRVFESIENQSLVSWNSMISCCSLNGFLDDALELLNSMVSSAMKPDLVTWNSLLSGYSRYGLNHDVFEIFRMIQREGLRPNSTSITSVLRTVTNSGLLKYGNEIHGFVVRHGFGCNLYVGTSLVDMYLKCYSITKAQRVFDTMKHRNVLTWNSLISGYAHEGLFNESLDLLKQMEMEGLQPDLTTWNGLISGYSMNGLSTQAMLLIRQIKMNSLKPNVVSWTALISGCCQNGEYEDSLYFFTEMQKERIQPNSVTVASLLRACAGLALLKKGRELHCFALRKGFDTDIFVATALVDMYSKSASLRNAYNVFMRIQNKNLASWNAMIAGFAAHGQGKEVMLLFDEMCQSGNRPDGITFTAVLSGCRHAGLVSEGWKYFDEMKNCYGVTPTLEHYTCMVDLLARGGYLDEAMDFIQSMPFEPDAGVWGALLGACRNHKNLEFAEAAAKHLFRLEPYNSANYLLIMTLYAYENRWEDAENIKVAMNARGVKSRAGWSWIQIDQTIHVFDVEGMPHPDTGEIYYELYQLVSEMRRLGYVPDTGCIVRNVGQEEKEKMLMSHTEKLAITYGLINTDKSTPIRVIKNTRVCNDCHTMAKYLSRICSHEIFLRDGVRFHHFMDGKCSCNDYW